MPNIFSSLPQDDTITLHVDGHHGSPGPSVTFHEDTTATTTRDGEIIFAVNVHAPMQVIRVLFRVGVRVQKIIVSLILFSN